MKNIVLIGMPASGKSTIGKLLAQKINYEYYDADKYLETKYLKKLAYKNRIIISTGGGSVKRSVNMEVLKKKGIIIFLNRKIEDIAKENHKYRPLLQDINNIEKLYSERIDLYKKYADITIENNDTLFNVVDKLYHTLKENKLIK